MTKEDLFLAIGQVEESRLARSELTMQEPSLDLHKEEPEMQRKSVRVGRIVRNLIAAVIIISMLGVTAYAAAAYLIFDSPEEMVTAIFGDKTGFDHKDVTTWTDPEKPGSVYENPAYDRVPAEEAAVEEAAPLVEAVGQSISWNGYTLTIDANLYDYATKCGLVTYILENPEGLPEYRVANNGEISFSGGEIVGFGQYGYSYIIQDQSSDTKLTATYYYQLRDSESTDLEIGFTEWASRTMEEKAKRIEEIKQELRQEISEEEALAYRKKSVGDSWPWFEENRTREENIESAYEEMAYLRLEDADICPNKIIISESEQSEMTNITVGNGAVKISPIAITVKVKEIENFPNSFLDVTKILFSDNTEYVVKDDNTTQNLVFAVADSETEETTFMFNRIIDVTKVTSVIVDGNIELTVD